ncbi:MAG: 50S ribosomal protein L25 [Bacteroidota bacterium]
MKTISIKAYDRPELGKASTRELRKEDKVPAVLYDNGKASHITINYLDARSILYTADTYIVNLDLEGGAADTIIREAQYHPVTDKIEHIDFLKVGDKEVELTLPITLTGTPKGVIKGGRLMTKLRKIKVKGIPAELPELIQVDVSHLELGTSIKVSDLSIEGLKITSGGSAAIASVEIPRALRSAKSAEGEEGAAADEE